MYRIELKESVEKTLKGLELQISAAIGERLRQLPQLQQIALRFFEDRR